jgi:glycosyltransferase involved in cell wall biosynthesis
MWNLPAILRDIRRAQPEVIHIQYPTTAYRRDWGINLLPLCLRITMPTRPVVVTLHEYHDASLIGRIRSYGTALFANRVIVSNPQDRDGLKRLLPWRPPVVIPIGINVGPGGVNEELRERLLKKFGLESGQFAAYFGIIDPSKGVDKLLESVTSWPVNLRLVIIGREKPDDEYHQRLRRRINELGAKVIWTGYLDDSSSASLLSAAMMAIQPFAQPVSMRRSTVLTPLSLGVPTITTGPLPLPLKEEENVLGLEDNSPAHITDRIQRLFNDAELRKILRSNGLKLAKKFDWDEIASEHVRLYSKIF